MSVADRLSTSTARRVQRLAGLRQVRLPHGMVTLVDEVVDIVAL